MMTCFNCVCFLQPPKAQELINKLMACENPDLLCDLLGEVSPIWPYETVCCCLIANHCFFLLTILVTLQCHLSCWTKLLDKLDSILHECCLGADVTSGDQKWPILPVDKPEFGKKKLLLHVLSFSALLAKNSSKAAQVYNSTEVINDATLKLHQMN